MRHKLQSHEKISDVKQRPSSFLLTLKLDTNLFKAGFQLRIGIAQRLLIFIDAR